LTQYLRRTFASVAADTPEVSWLALKLLLNHTTRGDVTAGYVQISTEQRRGAVQRVADKMLALCDVQHIAEGNVARLRSKDCCRRRVHTAVTPKARAPHLLQPSSTHVNP
jgi:hypothetical protein